ncbi:MAG: 4-hydroxyproline epimerase [Cyclobacteriaceae bacterium]|nr:4-hydroxyproline epimerase [Cyclobacteriaceae bacterium]
MKQVFKCIDGHTCGNPVRLVVEGGPQLEGASMGEKRLHFMKKFDWIRKGLMFEPRGHDMMSGSILYPPSDPANDVGVLFIETSGCLPMCGHGTIGTITMAIENGLIKPKTEGKVRMEAPAGLVPIEYKMEGNKVSSVKLFNVPSFLALEGLEIESPHLGKLTLDVAYGGNFYAIIDPQKNFRDMNDFTAAQLIEMSRSIRELINEKVKLAHPLDASITGCSHVMWTGKPIKPESTARNAVFYGDKAIDRSPCGTGTSARMAQWYAKDKLKKGDVFIHESIIGSQFVGRVEEDGLAIENFKGIVPSIEGWAKSYGRNEITIDTEDDPMALGFQVI